MKVLFVLLSVAAAVVLGDITTITVHTGDTVCATTTVNARNQPSLSGAVVTQLHAGDCGTIHGGILTADGYKWYELDYNGQRIWVAGKYLVKSDVSADAQCGVDRKNKACALLAKHNQGILQLAKHHPSGVQDNAYAYNNIKDMCDGKKASRSSYSCSTCPSGTPGGTVCLTNNLLDYLIDLASRGRVIVNELAGACHSCTSRHYNGQAVDLHNDARSSEYMSRCTQMAGWALDEHNHIHCQFYD